MLQSAVERQFEIIGEALAQARKEDSGIVCRIQEADRIIAFRNRHIHGYATLSDKVVWGIVQDKLKTLKNDIESLS